MKFTQTGANGINGTNDIVTLSDTCLSGARSKYHSDVVYARAELLKGLCSMFPKTACHCGSFNPK